jgi:hypothetical protein
MHYLSELKKAKKKRCKSNKKTNVKTYPITTIRDKNMTVRAIFFSFLSFSTKTDAFLHSFTHKETCLPIAFKAILAYRGPSPHCGYDCNNSFVSKNRPLATFGFYFPKTVFSFAP